MRFEKIFFVKEENIKVFHIVIVDVDGVLKYQVGV